jgi:hypothetical protein
MHDSGLLPTDRLVKVGAEDMVGSYVGQTKDLVTKFLNDALGGVLFIDEAHRLNPRTGAGGFKQEAIGKILEAIESPEYKNKLLVVMAGYVDDIDDLIRTDQGLARRFRKKILFRALELDASINAFISRLKVHPNVNVDEDYYRPIVKPLFEELIAREGWSSLDDIDKLVKGFDRELAVENKKNLDNAVKNDENVEELQQKQLKEYSSIVYSQQIIEKTFRRVINSRSIKGNTAVRSTADQGPYRTADDLNRREKPPDVHIDKPKLDEPEVEVLSGGGSGDGTSEKDVILTCQQLYVEFSKNDDVTIEDIMKEAIAKEESKAKLAKILNEEPEKLSDDYVTNKSRELEEKRSKLKEKRRKSMVNDLDSSKTAINLLMQELENEKNEELRKKKEIEIERNKQKAIKALSRCENNFDFEKVPGGYRCTGGGHFIPDSMLQQYL